MGDAKAQVKDIITAGENENKKTLVPTAHTTSLHKIVRALYYIARNIDDSALAASLKKVAVDLLGDTYTLFRTSDLSLKDTLSHRIAFEIDEIRLSLQLLFEEGWITELQRDLFRRELTRFDSILQNLFSQREEEEQSSSRFLSPIDLSSLFSQQGDKEQESEKMNTHMTKNSLLSTEEKRKVAVSKQKRVQKRVKKENTRSLRKDTLKKEERKRTILSHLRKSGSCSLPEIAELFEGASQKTIQRDLRELISQGLVEREGERRWAKYRVVD